jgi:hypothetical protein
MLTADLVYTCSAAVYSCDSDASETRSFRRIIVGSRASVDQKFTFHYVAVNAALFSMEARCAIFSTNDGIESMESHYDVPQRVCFTTFYTCGF